MSETGLIGQATKLAGRVTRLMNVLIIIVDGTIWAPRDSRLAHSGDGLRRTSNTELWITLAPGTIPP
jgi:hypothetical protein